MEELIKYFESLEARISALEQTQANILEQLTANDTKLVANEEKVKVLGEKIIAVGGHISQMMAIIQEAKSQQQFAAAAPEQKSEPEPVIEPEEPVTVIEPEAAPEPMAEVTAEPIVPEEPQQTKQTELFVVPEPVKEAPAKEEPAQEPTSSKAMLYGKPVTDIRQAISLGDRFLYQRELFGQNAELMQKTLNDLNALRSFDEAVSYIMTHFKWDSDSTTYQQFLVTLHRRFG